MGKKTAVKAPSNEVATSSKERRAERRASLPDAEQPNNVHTEPHKLGHESNSHEDLNNDGTDHPTKTKRKKGASKKSNKSKSDTSGTANGSGSTEGTQSLPPLTPNTPSRVSSRNEGPGSGVAHRSSRRKRGGEIQLQRQATVDVVVKYQLGQTELRMLKTCFNQIDLDQSGMIDYDEFFEFIDERKTPFSEGLFRMIDADSNGTIDYEEFVHAMVLYCMYTRDEILQFAFDTFDPGKTGSIGEKEFKRLISVVNDGKPAYPGNFKNALQEFDRNKDGVLDFDEFKILNKRYPMLLFPCFRLQDRMQKSTLGEGHWHKLHKKLCDRIKLEQYQRKHNGALPALGLMGSIRKFLGLDKSDIYQQ